jgi:hypothetical protein
MKHKILSGLFGLLAAGSAMAQGLYYAGTEATEALPLKWVVGTSLVYDDNVNPGFGEKTDSLALNPYVGLSFVHTTPQSTLDVYGRLGMVYYFDAPGNMDDMNSQSRAGINYTHRFTERLRFVSRNFISYELEPDYSYGYATNRSTGEYFFWQTDNSVGFRWSERVATYTGLRLSGTDYTDSDAPNNDRFTWELYNQFRYQLSPQTVLTADYRYNETSGNGETSDSTNHYILVGAEHRFSPNTIAIIRAGAQLRKLQSTSETSPYVEFVLNSQLTKALRVGSFARYGIEDYDTIQNLVGGTAEYANRRTLRFGLSSEYVISPMLSLNGGLDYIPTAFRGGEYVDGSGSAPDWDEALINAYVGVSVRFNDFLTGMVSYNFTDSSSDDDRRDYNRNRISVGLSAEF